MFKNYIDHAACITVKGSKRIKDFIENNKKVDLDVKIYEFPNNYNNNKNGADKECSNYDILSSSSDCCGKICLEITKNHIHVIKEAFKKNKRNVLIFEDDSRWECDSTQLDAITEWMKNNEWDIFYLGYFCFPNFIGRPISKNVVKLFSPLLTHAYIVNRSAMLDIIQNENNMIGNKIPIDVYYKQKNFKKFGAYPCLAYPADPPGHCTKFFERVGLPAKLLFKPLNKIFNFLTYYFIILTIFAILAIILIYIVNK